MEDQLDLAQYEAPAFSRALGLLSRFEEWEEEPSKNLVRALSTSQIVSYTYKPYRFFRAVELIQRGVTLPAVEMVRYVVGEAAYYVPSEDWHGIEAAKTLKLQTVLGKVAGTYRLKPARYYLDPLGLWWLTGQGLDELREHHARLSQAERQVLTALGVITLATRQ